MNICAISDQHGHLPEIPPCDLLLIAGDLCPATNHGIDFQRDWLDGPFRHWLHALRHVEHVVGIAGNHDFIFEQRPDLVPAYLPWTYLQDSGCEVAGLKIWGTPWQPVFFDWAFNGKPEELKAKWALIPFGTDVLVVHGPPRGYGDRTTRSERTGCPHLLERVFQVRPRLTVFGHIHEGRGRWDVTAPPPASGPRKAPEHLRGEELLRWAKARKPLYTECLEFDGMSLCVVNPELLNKQITLANVTVLDERYRPAHAPMVFELEPAARAA